MRCREQCYNSVVWVIPPSVVLLRYCPECPSTDTQDWQALFTRCARWYSARVRVTGKPGTLRKRSKFSLMRLSAGFKNFALFLVYESYEISRYRNQNLEITTKATKFLGDLEITTKSEILRWTNHTNPETLSPTNSHHETFSKFLAVLGLSKILAILEGSEQIFPRKRSLGAPDIRVDCRSVCSLLHWSNFDWLPSRQKRYWRESSPQIQLQTAGWSLLVSL